MPTPVAASPDVAVLASVARDLVAVALRTLAPEPVSPPQFRLLLLLREDGPVGSAAAARALDVAPSTVTRVTTRLAAAGLLHRGADPRHRGGVRLRLTEEGRALVDRVLQRRHDELGRVLDAMDPGERRAVVDGLAALRAGLSADRAIGGLW